MHLRPRTNIENHEGASRGDAGFTLVEVLVSMVLMAMVVAAILPAMWTTIRISRFSDSEAKVEAVLGGAVDRVTNFGWIPCPETDSTGGYSAKAKAAASMFDWPATTVVVTGIKFWDVTTKKFGTTNPAQASGCARSSTALTKERTLQQVTIKVTSPDLSQTNQITLVVGDIRTDEELDAT
jgi:prepilin-type N-terminal cleavage/methylation domain-containing protein